MKETHNAAMVLVQRMYGELPQYDLLHWCLARRTDALAVAQCYLNHYDGVAPNVPIVNFSSVMLAPALIRIQESHRRTGSPPPHLDGLVDGIINNYMAPSSI